MQFPHEVVNYHVVVREKVLEYSGAFFRGGFAAAGQVFVLSSEFWGFIVEVGLSCFLQNGVNTQLV